MYKKVSVPSLLIMAQISLLLIIPFKSNSQTPVSGIISSNTVWNINGSPYIVTGNLLVSQGITLTIDPGVIIKFDGGKALQIDGEIIAIGTPLQRILFTSNGSLSNGYWSKIQFSDLSVDAVFNGNGNYVSGNILKYCDFIYGGGGSNGTIQCNNAAPYICHCKIVKSGGNGIYFSGLPVPIDSCNISENASSGIFSEYTNYTGCLRITCDTIKNNPGGGIFLGDNSTFECYTNKIEKNIFENNSTYGAIWVNFYIFGIIISENYFANNSSSQGGAINFSADSVTLQCNQFFNNYSTNDGGALWWASNNNEITSTVHSNIFKDNHCSGQGAAMYINGTLSNHPCVIHINNNVITNNFSNNGSSVYLKGNMGTSTIVDKYQVLNNDIQNNNTNSTLYLTYFDGIISNNNLNNPSTQYEILNSNTSGMPNISCNNNYWGTANTSHIDSVIYDFFDNANLSVVYYAPVASTPFIVDTSCVTHIFSVNTNEIRQIGAIVYPNPAHKTITIITPTKGSISILSIKGQQLLQHETTEPATTVDISAMPSGVYFVRVTGETRVEVGKFIKQ